MNQSADNVESNTSLLELAERKFGELTDAERLMFEKSEEGMPAECIFNGSTDPAEASGWDKARVIHANRIEWLCTDAQAKTRVTRRGIQVGAARIDGELDLDFARIPFPLVLLGCAFTDPINLRHAEVRGLYLDGTHTKSILADCVKVKGNVFLRDKFSADGEVRLLNASIGGSLECDNATFSNPDGYALNAGSMTIEGSVLFRDKFSAVGEVRLLNASVGGNLDCTDSTFSNPDGYCLNADGVKVEGSVFLCDKFSAEGEVRLLGGSIGGNLSCIDGMFSNPAGDYCLNAGGVKVEGSVSLRDKFSADGEVHLLSASIGGSLECDNGTFSNPGGYALNANRMTVKGSVFFRYKFSANGELCLLGASIGSNLECIDSTFNNPDGYALNAGSMTVKGSVFLRNKFSANGEVRLLGTSIGGNLDCSNGTFSNPDGDYCLNAEGVKVEGNVFLHDRFEARGRVAFVAAEAKRFFRWHGVGSPNTATLDLRSAKIGTLWGDEKSWPEKGNLYVQGLEYDEIYHDAPNDAKARIRWLRLQPETDFSPQPYEQLAKVLKNQGHERAAKDILVAMNEDPLFLKGMGWVHRPLHWLYGFAFGYKHNFRRAWRPILILIAIGWCVFWLGFQTPGVMVPKAPPVKTSASAIMYSIDLFVPVIDLRQAKLWEPDPSKKGAVTIVCFKFHTTVPVSGRWLRRWMWIHIFAGWVLTTLFVVGLTGLIRS